MTFSPNAIGEGAIGEGAIGAIGVGAIDTLPPFAPTPMALGLNVEMSRSWPGEVSFPDRDAEG